MLILLDEILELEVWLQGLQNCIARIFVTLHKTIQCNYYISKANFCRVRRQKSREILSYSASTPSITPTSDIKKQKNTRTSGETFVTLRGY